MSKHNEIEGLQVLIAFLIGGMVGAGAALLMAPQSGRKTRRQLRQFVEDTTEHAVDYAERLKERVL